jgi:hypothetical protein
MYSTKANRFFSFISIILTVTFLYQNILWASGDPSHLSPKSGLDSNEFHAVLKAFSAVHNTTGLKELADIHRQELTEETIQRVNEDFLNSYFAQNEEGVFKADVQRCRDNFRIIYDMGLDCFYFYEINSQKKKSVICRIASKTFSQKIAEGQLFRQRHLILDTDSKPIYSDVVGGKLKIEIFESTPDLRQRIASATENHVRFIINKEPDAGPSGAIEKSSARLASGVLRVIVFLILLIPAVLMYTADQFARAETPPRVPAGEINTTKSSQDWLAKFKSFRELENRLEAVGYSRVMPDSPTWSAQGNFDSLNGVLLRGDYGNSNWGIGANLGAGSPLSDSFISGFGVDLDAYLQLLGFNSQRIFGTVNGGLLSQDGSPNSTYFALLGSRLLTEGDEHRTSSFFNLGYRRKVLGGELEGGQADSLLLAGGTNLVIKRPYGTFIVDLRLQGPYTFSLTGDNINKDLSQADIDRQYEQLLTDLSSFRAAFAYRYWLFTLEGFSHLGGLEQLAQDDLPDNSFSRLGGQLTWRFRGSALGQNILFIPTFAYERISPSFSDSSTHIITTALEYQIPKIDLSLSGGMINITEGADWRLFAEARWRLFRQLEIMASFNPIPPFYSSESYDEPYSPRPMFALSLTGALPELPETAAAQVSRYGLAVQSQESGAFERQILGPAQIDTQLEYTRAKQEAEDALRKAASSVSSLAELEKMFDSLLKELGLNRDYLLKTNSPWLKVFFEGLLMNSNLLYADRDKVYQLAMTVVGRGSGDENTDARRFSLFLNVMESNGIVFDDFILHVIQNSAGNSSLDDVRSLRHIRAMIYAIKESYERRGKGTEEIFKVFNRIFSDHIKWLREHPSVNREYLFRYFVAKTAFNYSLELGIAYPKEQIMPDLLDLVETFLLLQPIDPSLSELVALPNIEIEKDKESDKTGVKKLLSDKKYQLKRAMSDKEYTPTYQDVLFLDYLIRTGNVENSGDIVLQLISIIKQQNDINIQIDLLIALSDFLQQKRTAGQTEVIKRAIAPLLEVDFWDTESGIYQKRKEEADSAIKKIRDVLGIKDKHASGNYRNLRTDDSEKKLGIDPVAKGASSTLFTSAPAITTKDLKRAGRVLGHSLFGILLFTVVAGCVGEYDPYKKPSDTGSDAGIADVETADTGTQDAGTRPDSESDTGQDLSMPDEGIDTGTDVLSDIGVDAQPDIGEVGADAGSDAEPDALPDAEADIQSDAAEIGPDIGVNELPVIEIPEGAIIVNEGEMVRIDASGSRDPEGIQLDFTWEQIDENPIRLNIQNTDGPILEFIAPLVGIDTIFTIRLTVSDGQNEVTRDIPITVSNMPAVNHPPVAVITSDDTLPANRIVQQGALVNLSGAGSRDPDQDDNVVSYSWRIVQGGGSLSSNNQERTTYNSAGANGRIIIELTVADTHNVISASTIEFDINRAPIANGNNQNTIQGTETAHLQIIANDPDNDQLQYEWRISAGQGELINIQNNQADFRPANINQNVTIEIVVSDGRGGSRTVFISFDVERTNTVSWIIDSLPGDQVEDLTFFHNFSIYDLPQTARFSSSASHVSDGNAAIIIGTDTFSLPIDRNTSTDILTNGYEDLIIMPQNGQINVTFTAVDNQNNVFYISFSVDVAINAENPFNSLIISPEQINQGFADLGLNPADLILTNVQYNDLPVGFEIIGPVPAPVVIAGAGAIQLVGIGTFVNEYVSGGNNADITVNDDVVRADCQVDQGANNGYAGIEIPTYTTQIMPINPANVSASSFAIIGGVEDRYQPYHATDGKAPIVDPADAAQSLNMWICHNRLGDEQMESDPQPWIQLDFTNPQDITAVRIWPRNLGQITQGRLTFSDGSSLDTGVLNAGGTLTVIEFPLKHNISWVRFQILEHPGVINAGLGEIQVLGAVYHNNFSQLQELPVEIRGTGPVMAELFDGVNTITVPILGIEDANFRAARINIEDITIENPEFSVQNVTRVRFFVDVGGWFEIRSIYQPEPTTQLGTRGGFAHDPDLTDQEAQFLLGNLSNAVLKPVKSIEGYKVYEISEWDGVLSNDGLFFKIGNNRFSAFYIGNRIYIPSQDTINELAAKTTPKLLEAVTERLNIILYHEVHEIKTGDHQYAVLTEFEKHINGLNYADVTTILLQSLRGNAIDISFHERFIKNLVTQGMGLFMTDTTYLKIIHEMVDPTADEQEIKAIYRDAITHMNSLIISHINGKQFVYNTDDFNVTIDRFNNELGIRKLAGIQVDQETRGTIYIDLDGFFIKNTSLSSAITIDTEYLKRFIACAKFLAPGIGIVGLTEKSNNDIVLGQLANIIQNQLQGRFELEHTNVAAYLDRITEVKNSVFILTKETLTNVSEISKRRHKILVRSEPEYNQVTDIGYEFYTAFVGLGKTRDEFKNLVEQITEELLSQLLAMHKITEADKQKILSEIRQLGIFIMPRWKDPTEYYRNIQSQKALLIAA